MRLPLAVRERGANRSHVQRLAVTDGAVSAHVALDYVLW